MVTYPLSPSRNGKENSSRSFCLPVPVQNCHKRPDEFPLPTPSDERGTGKFKSERRFIVPVVLISIRAFGAAFEGLDAQFRRIEECLAMRRERHPLLICRQRFI